MLATLVVNFALLFIYLIVCSIMPCAEEDEVYRVEGSEEAYCVFGVWGATFSLTILLLEFTVFLFVKYYQSNFSFTIPVSSLLACCLITTGALLAVFNTFAVNGEYVDQRSKDFFSQLLNEFMMFFGFAYLTALFVGLILLEYN
jgi:hypothetical protein